MKKKGAIVFIFDTLDDTNVPHLKKIWLLQYAIADQPTHQRRLTRIIVIRCQERIIAKLAPCKVSILQLVCVDEQCSSLT